MLLLSTPTHLTKVSDAFDISSTIYAVCVRVTQSVRVSKVSVRVTKRSGVPSFDSYASVKRD